MRENWDRISFADLITERKDRFDPDAPEIRGLQKIEKIDFSEGKIHLGEYEPTKTQQIIVEPGDFVFSGLNIEKGAAGFNETGGRLVVSANYSTCSYNDSRVNLDFFKHYMRSENFQRLLKENLKKDYGFTRPKHLLPLMFLVPRDKGVQQRIVAEYEQCKETGYEFSGEIAHQQSLLAKLKQAILLEAIQGKLTADWRAVHPDVEPASQLLHRIQSERARLIAAKKLRREKFPPTITPAEIPFEIPKSWEWCRLGEGIRLLNGNSFESSDFRKGSGVKCVKITNAGVGEFVETDDTLPVGFDRTYANYQVFSGDLILALTRPYIATGLKISRCPKSYNGALLNQRVAAIRPIEGLLDSDYAFLFLGSDFVLRGYQAEFESKGQQPNLKSEHVTHLRLPLPPLAEQAAIVARAEALMTNCRALEAEIEHVRTHANRLLQAVLKEAFAPASL
jgi:type I restriction enzyme S subunit